MTEPLDISTEEYRFYTYANGSQFRIERPVSVFAIEDAKGVSHRVVDADGVTHRPERGWVGISWKPFHDAPAFVA